ncbi:MAG: cytochrome c biogenesis protein ResB [Desulforhopalus sp.]
MKLFNQLWDFFSSVKLAIFTLCALAVTSIVGTIIPQGESAAFYVKNFGAKTALFFQILDIPEMYYSWWFLGLLGLLCTNIIVCSIDRFPNVWKLITRDNLAVPADRVASMAHSFQWVTDSSQNEPFDPAGFLKKNGWRSSTRKSVDNELYFAQKGRWSRVGVYVVHLSILVIFVGALIGHFLGFKGSVMVPELGSTDKAFAYKSSEPIPLGFEIRCNRFVIEFYDNGMPKEYQSSLTVLENGKEQFTKEIEVNDPLTYKGITFYQSSYQGYQDFIISVTEMVSGQKKQFTVPFQQQSSWEEQGVQFGVVNAEAAGQRVVRSKIWFKAVDSPAVIQWLPDNEEMTISAGDKQYLVTAKQMYATGLQVAKDPGVWTVYLGCGLMLAGLYMAFFMSHKRVWISRRKEAATTKYCLGGSANKNKPAFKKSFDHLVKQVDPDTNS